MPARAITLIPAGAEVLFDVNVLVYGLLAKSPQCERLLERCAAREISGFATVEVLADTLLTNDSLLLAACEVFGIPSLATNDSDFDAVPGVTLYKPTDVP